MAGTETDGVAAGTKRTATNRRLVELVAELDGFSPEPENGTVHVTRPLGSPPKNRRHVVIGGTRDGDTAIAGIAAGHQPSEDSWRIPCFIGVNDLPADTTPGELEQTVEDAYNAIADLLASNARLARAGDDGNVPGLWGLRATNPNTYSIWENGRAQAAWAEFEIEAHCTIERHQP